MSLKGKPVCAQNLFGNLLRDPRKTQPWIAMQMIQHWARPSCLRTILWGGFWLGTLFSHPENCGMRSQCSCGCGDAAWKIQMQIQVNQVDGSVCTSCARGSRQLLKVLLNTQNLLLADDSKHNCSPRQVKECVCSDNVISLDFPEFPWISLKFPGFPWISLDFCTVGPAGLKQFLVILSSLILMPCSYPEMAFGFLNELSGIECH